MPFGCSGSASRARTERWVTDRISGACTPSGLSFGVTARVMFGSTSVPCEAINSSMLRCRTPTHEAGVVRVQLIRCEDDEPAVDGDDDDGDVATFEFVRLETAYDRIFATTNSFCPVRSSQQEEDDQMKADAAHDPKWRQ